MCAVVDKSSGTGGNAEFVSLRLDLPTRRQLEKLARKNERTLSGEIRIALRQHLEKAA
jgi:predicted transcriptional regulator